tara:strand:- start:5777 stop:5974 length:198 start_codon:yes stop_codon:yes gene_type:complete
MATFQTFVKLDDNKTAWFPLAKGKDIFSKADEAGKPIRIVHPSGSFKVIRNADNLPEGEPTSSRA